MVAVRMRDQHVGHLGGIDAGGGEALGQRATDLGAEAGVDQHGAPRQLDQQRIDAERQRVGRRARCAQHRRDGGHTDLRAEHAGVVGHRVDHVAQRDEPQAAELERGGGGGDRDGAGERRAPDEHGEGCGEERFGGHGGSS